MTEEASRLNFTVNITGITFLTHKLLMHLTSSANIASQYFKKKYPVKYFFKGDTLNMNDIEKLNFRFIAI